MGGYKSLDSLELHLWYDKQHSYGGQNPGFLYPESPRGKESGVAAVADGLMTTASFVY